MACDVRRLTTGTSSREMLKDVMEFFAKHKAAKPLFRFAFFHNEPEQVPDSAIAGYFTSKTGRNSVCMNKYSAIKKRHLADSDCNRGDGICHEYCLPHDMR